MKQFFLTMAGVFAGLLVFFVVVPFILIMSIVASAQPKDTTPSVAVLQLDLRDGLTDQDPQNPFAMFGGSGMSVISVIETLKHAQADDKVKGVFVRLPEGGMAPAAADELRQAFLRFRQAGKPIWAHSQGLYPSGVVSSTYMLGAATDQLWMQPDSAFQATGFAVENMFFKRLFDKYGVKAEFEQRREYKNAVNPYLFDNYTPAHKEAELSWMTSIYRTAVLTAAIDRKKEPIAFARAFEAGPYSAEDAKAKGLIDGVAQVRETSDALLAKAGKKARLIDFDDYMSTVRRQAKTASALGGKPAIAVIGAEGPIMTGTSGGGNLFSGDETVWSDDVANAFYKAIEDKDVKAIVFRVSSPGGSPEASEQILAAVRAARAAGKPVVVSMGAYAASGGYWISSEADYIVAQPSTLTGSIGVFGGKFVLADALGRFGVDIRDLSVGGDYADAFSPARPFTASQRAAYSASIDRTYEEFIARVAAGRHLPPARVREIARGRVWTGRQAKDLGLVDELGGLHEAIIQARRLAEIPADESVRFKHYPTPESPWEALSTAFGVSGEAARVLVGIGGVMADPQAQVVMRRIEADRMRSTGASVLAEQPLN